MAMAWRPVCFLVLLARVGQGTRVATWTSEPEGHYSFENADDFAAMSSLPVDMLRQVLAMVPGQPIVAWSTGGRTAALMGLRKGEQARQLRGHENGVQTIKFFPGGDRLATLGFDADCIVWDVWTGAELRRLQLLRDGAEMIHSMEIFPDGARLATLGGDARLLVWSVASGVVLLRADLAGGMAQHVCRIFPDGASLATGVATHMAAGGEPIVWDVQVGQPRYILPPETRETILLELSPCGTVLATAGFATVGLWDASSGRLLRELSVRSWHLHGLAVTRGAAQVLGSGAGSILIWSGGSGVAMRSSFRGAGPPYFRVLPEIASWSSPRAARASVT